jgi:isopenicillin N synthase-like dioxygenase
MPNASVIPVIDLGPYLAGEPGALDRTAAELRHALTEIGFYSIVNHGVPSALVHEVYRQVARFHAQPLDEKLKIKLDKHNVGYLQMMGDTLRTSVVAKVTKPNMNEAFFMARDLAPDHPEVVSGRRFRSANQWPEGLPGFREPLVEYCDAQERLVKAWCAFMPARSTCPPHISMGRSPTSNTSCARHTTRRSRRRPRTNLASRRTPIRVS